VHAFPVALLLLGLTPADLPINPAHPKLIASEVVTEWSFREGTAGWTAQHDCSTSAEHGRLIIVSIGGDPYLHRKVTIPGGQFLLRMKARAKTDGPGQIYWTTDQSPHRGEDKEQSFPLKHDGQWREYEVAFTARGVLTDIRLDPGQAPGQFEIEWIRLIRQHYHPLSIAWVETIGTAAVFHVSNAGPDPQAFTVHGKTYRVAPSKTIPVELPLDPRQPLDTVTLQLECVKLPSLCRTVFVYHPQAQATWLERETPEFTLRTTRDGSMARIERAGQPVAIIAPLVHCEGQLPKLQLVEESDRLRFQGDGISLAISTAGKEITLVIDSRRPCEGPVVRTLGALKQGLLAGVEYLGRGEKSSTTLDIETDGHLRYAPDPLKVTMPLMAFTTDRGSVAMTWNDMSLQPTFASPNFFDGQNDHRMALRGTHIEATLRVDHEPLEEAIRWAAGRRGLPPLPQSPRTRRQQWDLCMRALNGPLKSAAGWGHCVEAHFTRHPYSGVASTVWRLTGQAPDLPQLASGGVHVPNDTIYFVTGRARQWLNIEKARVEAILKRQQADGSFRYDGKYARGHFETTASGVCAIPLTTLLEYVRVTGDRRVLAAAVRTLDYLDRFDVPRGAQVWEVPLHTPDQLASAYAVWACVRGYELTGNRKYLVQARRWALSGVPFTYLWSRYPVMLYATPPVFGATNWTFNWIGLPVQWVGGVYAYALTLLAPYDSTLDWKHLARGILITAEQMQYPDGPYAGLLPDSFVLESQERRPSRINPCALVSLQMALDREVDFLGVAADGRHRVAAPFPVVLGDDSATIHGRPGVAYQVIVDGARIVEVKSHGEDVIPLQ
jgi:hypothetical protein